MFSNTVVDPRAVVVVLLDANIANGAMVLPRTHLADTDHAEVVNSSGLGVLLVVAEMNWYFAILEDQTAKKKKSQS